MRRVLAAFVFAACAAPQPTPSPATSPPPPVQAAAPAASDPEPAETGATGATSATGSSGSTGSTGATGATSALPQAATYTHTCDGSAGVGLEGDHFLNFNDEDQRAIVYSRGVGGGPVSASPLDLGTTDEADIEDAERVGARIFVISSHGRNTDGKLKRARHQFFALDINGTALTLAGRTGTLLDELLDEDNWETPDATLIGILDDASKLGTATKASLAPEKNGINIEGLAHWPTASAPDRLAIGLRNPRWNDGAIIVTLLNPNEVIDGDTAHFGEAYSVALGSLGIRSLLWSSSRNALLVLAGPSNSADGPFAVYEWSGAAATKLKDVPALAAGSPEALIAVGDALQVLVDQGDKTVGSGVCKDAAIADRSFIDLILPL